MEASTIRFYQAAEESVFEGPHDVFFVFSYIFIQSVMSPPFCHVQNIAVYCLVFNGLQVKNGKVANFYDHFFEGYGKAVFYKQLHDIVNIET